MNDPIGIELWKHSAAVVEPKQRVEDETRVVGVYLIPRLGSLPQIDDYLQSLKAQLLAHEALTLPPGSTVADFDDRFEIHLREGMSRIDRRVVIGTSLAEVVESHSVALVDPRAALLEWLGSAHPDLRSAYHEEDNAVCLIANLSNLSAEKTASYLDEIKPILMRSEAHRWGGLEDAFPFSFDAATFDELFRIRVCRNCEIVGAATY